MSNRMRWRAGETNPVICPVDSPTVIEIGDLVFLDTDDAKPFKDMPDQGTLVSNQQITKDSFLGVAMQASRAGDSKPIRVATTGVFEFEVASTTIELGEMLGAAEDGAGVTIQNQIVRTVATSDRALGRCAKRLNPAGTKVEISIVSTSIAGGVQDHT